MLRIVVDLGNTRLKLGRVDETGQLEYVEAIHLDSEDILEDTLSRWIGDGHTGSQWAISTVNPPTAKRLEQLLQNRGVADVVWYRSAAAVPVPHAIVSPETAGADRALAVSAALGRRPSGRPGFVVLCGTAVVVPLRSGKFPRKFLFCQRAGTPPRIPTIIPELFTSIACDAGGF